MEASVLDRAATLAHEIKNPISIVKANLDYLELSDEEKRYENNYKVMRGELDRIFEMLRSFCDKEGDARPARERVYLTEILEPLVYSLNMSFGGRCKISQALPEAPLPLYCSRDGLRRAFLNFLKNSIESVASSKKSAGWIQVAARKVGKTAVVTITDNGIGMTAEELERLNRPGYTTKESGSGLGFNIARETISAHGGRLVVKSRKNSGCMVTIRLPLDVI